MAKKSNVASLKDFNSAHYINDNEDIRAYLQVVEEECDTGAYSQALSTVFLAIGANSVAKALDMDVSRVWDVQEDPAQHLDDLKKIIEILKNGFSEAPSANPYAGSSFEDFLREEGIYDEVTAAAMKRILAEIDKQNSDKKGSK